MAGLVVVELVVYPVKGMAGIAVDAAAVQPCGLEGDRRWLVVDAAGRFLTQRVLPSLAVVQAGMVAGGLVLSAAGHGSVAVAEPAPDQPGEAVTIWRDRVQAVPAGGAGDAWLSGVLGVACRLVFLRDAGARPCSSPFARPGEVVSFADGFPVLLTSLGSLADLNARLRSPVEGSRFRPNLVVAGAGAWAEDCWRVIAVGGAVFRVAKACDRCIVTTIDQASGTRPDRLEPLKTLGTFRHDERGIMFGQNLVPLVAGIVRVGDRVTVVEAGELNVVPL